MCSEAGPRCRRNSSDADSDSGLIIPTPAPTPLRLRPNKNYSILKRAISSKHFLDFNFVASKKVCVDTAPVRANCGCNLAVQVIADSFECGRRIVLELIAIVTQPSPWP